MFKIAVLVSGGGTNLQNLIDRVKSGRLSVQIEYVIADRFCHGLERAESYGIEALLLDRRFLKDRLSSSIHTVLKGQVDCIVLAGFLSILDREFVDRWRGRIINIHPSLLPAYGGRGMYGHHIHKAVLAAGEKQSGCSVHYVEKDIDQGEVILQRKVPVLEEDTVETLQRRVLAEEYEALAEAVEILRKQFSKGEEDR